MFGYIKWNWNRPKPSTEKLEIKKLNKIKKKIILLQLFLKSNSLCKLYNGLKHIIKEQKIEKKINLNRINNKIGQN